MTPNVNTNIVNKYQKLSRYYSSDKVICISANLEPGKSYGFDYKLCFRTPKESDDYYFDIKIVEVPDNWEITGEKKKK